MTTADSNNSYSHHSEIGRKTALGLQIKVATKLFNYVALIFIVRYLGPTALGTIGYALSFIALFNLFADMGTGFAHRKIATEDIEIKKCNTALIILKIGLSLGMVTITLISISLLKFYSNNPFETPEIETVVYILLFDTFIRNIITMYRTLYGARLKLGAVSSYVVLGNFISMILRVSVSVLSLSVIALAYSSVVASIIVVSIVTFLFFKNNQLEMPDKFLLKKYLKLSLSVSILGLISPLLFNMDKLMLGFFLGVEQTGYYVASEKIAGLLVFFVAALANQLLVIFSDYESAGDKSKIRKISQKSEKYISLSILPFVITISLFSEDILSLFYGSNFREMSIVLIMLSLAVYMNLMRTSQTMQLMAGLHIKKTGILTLIMVFFNFLINILLIPDEFYGITCFNLGVQGAALGSLFTMILYGILQRLLVYKINGTLPHKGLMLQYFSASFSVFLFLYIKNLFIGNFYIIIFSLIGSLSTFFVLLYLFNEFNRYDYYFFMNALNPKKMLQYIKNDMSDMKITK